jgi:hypothetical protein
MVLRNISFIPITLLLASVTLSAQDNNMSTTCQEISEASKEFSINIYPAGRNTKTLSYHCLNDTLVITKYTATILPKLEGSGNDTIIDQVITHIPKKQIGKVRETIFTEGSIIIDSKNHESSFIRKQYGSDLSRTPTVIPIPSEKNYLLSHENQANKNKIEKVNKLRALINSWIEL